MSETVQMPVDAQNSTPEWLNDRQMEMVFFIERFHAMQGEVPTDAIMDKRFELFDGELDAFKQHPMVTKSMKYRGIQYPAAGDVLTARQMSAVAAMTNYVDKRSDEKKLRDIGISTREWSNWLLDEAFATYLRERSERMLQGSQHEAHLGLVKGMRNGNVASVKLYNEMTGRHNPEQDNAVNLRVLLGSIIEILQKYIKDPVMLHGIAGEMMNMASRESLNGNGGGPGRYAPIANSVIPGTAVELRDDL